MSKNKESVGNTKLAVQARVDREIFDAIEEIARQAKPRTTRSQVVAMILEEFVLKQTTKKRAK